MDKIFNDYGIIVSKVKDKDIYYIEYSNIRAKNGYKRKEITIEQAKKAMSSAKGAEDVIQYYEEIDKRRYKLELENDDKERIFCDYGIEIRKKDDKYYLIYDDGGFACHFSYIEISQEYAEKAMVSPKMASEVILRYTKNGKLR